MTATDEIRRLLDERGVEYTQTIVTKGVLFIIVTSKEHYFILMRDNDAGIEMWSQYFTPEQVIAATLGSGTCEIHDCEGSFSAVNRPVWRCDCGAFMTQYTDATTYHKPRFCPNCGRKVVDK